MQARLVIYETNLLRLFLGYKKRVKQNNKKYSYETQHCGLTGKNKLFKNFFLKDKV